MLEIKVIRNNDGIISHIETPLMGYDLLGTPKLNKGCAFTQEEREIFQLNALLPHQVETLEQQVARMYAQYNEHGTNLSKNIYLNVLHDYNETLFYHLVHQYLEEMLPIIYTPTVGEAVERFSLEHRKTRGLYLSYPERHQLKKIFDRISPKNVNLAVVTDGEGVLGLGDQGIGGINISSAKLMVYTLCGGISPFHMLPIQLDVGTNNPNLLADPMYLGWRHERITGDAYDEFIEMFVQAITEKFPHIYVHWEDFGKENARRILMHYRDKICTINGDMQSTGAVALACLLAGVKASGIPMDQQQIVIFGAGTAGVGIADQIIPALQKEGSRDPYAQMWLIDKDGLLMQNSSLFPFQKPYAVAHNRVAGWKLRNPNIIDLYDVIQNVKPTILIGASAKQNAFTEDMIKLMAKNVLRPIIMPLSNPTTRSEATPEDLLKWSEGRAMIATGSPFREVNFNDRLIRIAQCNNAFAFPGIGLGSIAVKAKYLSDGMLEAATDALSQCAPIHQDKMAPLLPKLSEIHSVSRKIGLAVALQARRENIAQIDERIELNQALNEVSWDPKYYPYRKI
ncbi:MAG TPA: NAD-dependent malic enzyme [Gammaproteobacteria bacterium]|jgi:malate dehydrogenase (oxaloacetate-decarboxylating)|nr:NAD-dependent malic enzyme [Gammaproteobacteria bacterium]